ncbi:protein PYRICULARIA ORYZAE RESISTANCE 21-like [Syzygium oleosum]|uniref:protein PYRICULARIA ORYZAE RESISTANCE 21-like n=1 Tax=Syzygium oleosum TaxID=219896 RepID=UPI0024BBDB5D|nr:protein PYRICULARIA ORYZAE RESISTANCE 21-like [Syzygium oleosum]
MAEKVTKMLIKVDLQCSRCYKKIRKILCKFPQIRDQIYDEKKNTVLITVLCCSPEKIRQKIICEGSETVQSIETPPDKDTKKPKKVRFIELPKETAKAPAPVPVPALPRKAPKPTPPKAPQQAPALPLPKASKPVVGYPPVPAYPVVWRRPVIGAVMDVGDQPTRVNVKIEVAILGRGGQ